MDKPLLCPKEVAAKIGVTTQTLANWRSSSDPKLPYIPFIKMGRSVRYLEDDVDHFLQTQILRKRGKRGTGGNNP
jgi:hypothetical protein